MRPLDKKDDYAEVHVAMLTIKDEVRKKTPEDARTQSGSVMDEGRPG